MTWTFSARRCQPTKHSLSRSILSSSKIGALFITPEFTAYFIWSLSILKIHSTISFNAYLHSFGENTFLVGLLNSLGCVSTRPKISSHRGSPEKVVKWLSSKIPKWSSRGGLEVEQWTDNSSLSFLVGSNPARRQKDFHSNSNSMGGALVNNIQKLTRSSLLD